MSKCGSGGRDQGILYNDVGGISGSQKVCNRRRRVVWGEEEDAWRTESETESWRRVERDAQ